MYFGLLSAFAQQKKENDENLPPSFRYKLKKEVPEIFFDFPDDEQKSVDSLRKTWYPVTAGHSVKREIDFMKKAVCEKLSNGDKVYRLKFNCDAVFDEIYFKELEIPKGTAIYAVYPLRDIGVPLSTQKDAVGQKKVFGDGKSLIIEYIQPKKVKQKPKIIVRNVSLLYSQNNTEKVLSEEDDLVCNPLIRCSLEEYNDSGFPISDALKDLLATSVVKLHIYRPPSCSATIPDWDCTGAFINNTDKRLFILTANHNLRDCYETGSSSNPVKLRIRFKHELVDCEEVGADIGIDHPLTMARA